MVPKASGMESKLHHFSEEHIQRLIKKYEGKDFGSKKKLTFTAADLLSESREIATYRYNTPFLEQFYATLNKQLQTHAISLQY